MDPVPLRIMKSRVPGDDGLTTNPPDRGSGSIGARLRRALAQRGLVGTARLAVRYVRLRAPRWAAYVREVRFDRRYGVDTRGVLYHADTTDQSYRDAHHYEGVARRPFRAGVDATGADPSRSTFIDIGCGKGKALILAAEEGFERVVGVELSPSLSRVAHTNLESYAQRRRPNLKWDVVTKDATTFAFPPEPTVLFLNNPFERGPMLGVLGRLEASLDSAARPFHVIYMNPVLAALLDGSPSLTRCAAGRGYVVYRA